MFLLKAPSSCLRAPSCVRCFAKGKFVDRIRLEVCGGPGGNGCASFELTRDGNKGADGANGGRGGDVYLKATESMSSLTFARFHIKGNPGGHGSSARRRGACAKPSYILVPVGTLVKEILSPRQLAPHAAALPAANQPRVTKVLADLDQAGSELLVARGGRGGFGNRTFKRSGERLATLSTNGSPGESKSLELELKLIADVGLVGYPNAGKSSFLSAVSHASPKIAPYPFTTLHPMVGIAEFDDVECNQIAVADIPGLIDGAHMNRGLGHQFLRHIERTKVLLYVLDMASTEGRDPLQDLQSLQRELSLYSPELLSRPAAIFANKVDRKPATCRENIRRLAGITSLPVVAGSAKLRVNLNEIMQVVRQLIRDRDADIEASLADTAQPE